MRTRREITSLSAAERLAFTSALQTIIANGVYGQFSSLLSANVEAAFGGAQFLPFHRLFILELEDALRFVDPSVSLPFWRWTDNWFDPAIDPVFGTDLFGGATPGQCIPDGPFKDLRAQVPNDHCVRREFNGREEFGMGDILFDEEGVLSQLLDLEYPEFESALEVSAAFVNLGVGGVLGTGPTGDMGAASTSANDPISFVHQAFVDKIYSDWQGINGAESYFGDHKGASVSGSDVLEPFGVAVSRSFNLPCVSYATGPVGRSGRSGRSRRPTRASRAAATLAVRRSRGNRREQLSHWVERSPVSTYQADKGLKVAEEAAVDAVVAGSAPGITVTSEDSASAAEDDVGGSGAEDE